jgi:hypothetical protein
MSEFDEYLERLHSALDLSRNRADEICAEVRTHLEARARQFRESGMGETAAAAEAVSSFGDAKQVAVRLAAANRRHRSAGAFRLVLAFAVAFGGMLVAFGLLEGDAPVISRLTGPILEQRTLLGHVLSLLVMVPLTAPAALLAGLLAGRQRWWIAGTPPALWGMLVVGLLAIENGLGQRAIEWEQTAMGAALVLGCGPAVAALGFAGARLSEQRIGGWIVRVLGVGYLVVLGVMALLVQVHDMVGLLAVIAVGLLVLGVLGAAALWAGGRRWRRAAGASSAASAVCLLAMIRIVQLTCQGFYSESQAARAWEWLIGVETFLAVIIGAAVFAIRGRSKEASTETPVG